MLHGPCGKYNPKCGCMEFGSCRFNYRKNFCNETVMLEHAYPLYRRKNESPEQAKLNVEWAVNYWLSKGCPKEKLFRQNIILRLPFLPTLPRQQLVDFQTKVRMNC